MQTDSAKEHGVYHLSCTAPTLNVFSVWCQCIDMIALQPDAGFVHTKKSTFSVPYMHLMSSKVLCNLLFVFMLNNLHIRF